MKPNEQPVRYETRRDPLDGNVLRKRGKLRLFAVYGPKAKGEKERAVEVKHNVMHSPDGMEQGVSTPGAWDLARTLLGHFLGTDDPYQGDYRAFSALHVARSPQMQPLKITAEQVQQFLNEKHIGE